MKWQRYFVSLSIVVVLFFIGCQDKQEEKLGASNKVQWVDPKTIQLAPIQHDQLTEEQLKRITVIQQTFAEVDPTPLQGWIEDFKRDHDPDREIIIWEIMADAYERYLRKHSLRFEQKKEVFGILLIRSGASEDDAMAHLKVKELSETEVKEVMQSFTEAIEAKRRTKIL